MSSKIASPPPLKPTPFWKKALFVAIFLAVVGSSVFSTLLLIRAPLNRPTGSLVDRFCGKGFTLIDRCCEEWVAHERRQWDRTFAKAVEQAQAGQLDKATHTLETLVLEIPPRNRVGYEGRFISKIYSHLGEYYKQGGQAERSLYAFQRAVDFQPLNSSYLALLGKARMEIGNPYLGREQLLESLSISPIEIIAVESLITYHLEKGELREALNYYNSYLRAFAMDQSTSEQDQPGIFLLEKGQEVAALPFAPLVDEIPHVYTIPIGTAAPLLKDRQIDAVRFRLRRPPISGRMFFRELSFHSTPDLLKIRESGEQNTTTLLKVTDFSESSVNAAIKKENFFWPLTPFPVITVPLGPQGTVVQGSQIDHLGVRLSIHKVIKKEIRDAVVKARKSLSQGAVGEKETP